MCRCTDGQMRGGLDKHLSVSVPVPVTIPVPVCVSVSLFVPVSLSVLVPYVVIQLMKVNYAVRSEKQPKFGLLMNFHEVELHLSQHLLIIAVPQPCFSPATSLCSPCGTSCGKFSFALVHPEE